MKLNIYDVIVCLINKCVFQHMTLINIEYVSLHSPEEMNQATELNLLKVKWTYSKTGTKMITSLNNIG